MKLIDLARELGADVPTLADACIRGNTWSDATELTAAEESLIRKLFELKENES